MILVLLGTQNNDFTRLLEAVQENINNKTINEEVIVQAGFTRFNSKDMKIFSLVDKDRIAKLQDKADLVICHGGVGSIVSSLEKGKKVIVVPRLKKYGEHVNNHQIQLAKKYANEGYVKVVLDEKDLGDAIKSMAEFEPKKYERQETNILSIISNYIDNN